MSEDEYHAITKFDVATYSCGLKAGERIRLKSAISITDHQGRPTGIELAAGEIWTVLRGSTDSPGVIFLREPSGKTHTWDDDPSIFDTFERVP